MVVLVAEIKISILGRKLFSCGQVKNLVKELTWILIGSLFSDSQSEARLAFDITLDFDYNSKVSIPGRRLLRPGVRQERQRRVDGGTGREKL